MVGKELRRLAMPAVLALILAAACTKFSSGEEGAADGRDAGLDAAIPGAAIPGAAIPDAAIPDAPFACGPTRVTSCAECPGAPIPCWFCREPDGVLATCVEKTDGSFPSKACGVLPTGWAYCKCTLPSDCPGLSQSCPSSTCKSCGEEGSGGEPCRSGRSCNRDKATCG